MSHTVDEEVARLLDHAESSKDLILEKIAAIRDQLGPLYTRNRIDVPPVEAGDPDMGHMVVVKQFNLLAEGLSSRADTVTPFAAEEVTTTFRYRLLCFTCLTCKVSCSGGFDSVQRDDVVFDFARFIGRVLQTVLHSIAIPCGRFRRWRLLEEILQTDANPDILTVQECDHFYDFFEPVLRAMGYDGAFAPKARSPCLRFGYYSDGVAIFWKRQFFERISDCIVPDNLELPPVASIGVILRHTPSGKIMYASTCHLKAKEGVDKELIRLAQLKRILAAIEINSGAIADIANMPILLMGDFNTTPTERRTPAEDRLVIDFLLRWRNCALASAYSFYREDNVDCDNPVQNYSTWKSRGGVEVKKLIDFIWYSRNHFRTRWILDTPEQIQIQNSISKLPDIRYPSDHCSLCAAFYF